MKCLGGVRGLEGSRTEALRWGGISSPPECMQIYSLSRNCLSVQPFLPLRRKESREEARVGEKQKEAAMQEGKEGGLGVAFSTEGWK